MRWWVFFCQWWVRILIHGWFDVEKLHRSGGRTFFNLHPCYILKSFNIPMVEQRTTLKSLNHLSFPPPAVFLRHSSVPAAQTEISKPVAPPHHSEIVSAVPWKSLREPLLRLWELGSHPEVYRSEILTTWEKMGEQTMCHFIQLGPSHTKNKPI